MRLLCGVVLAVACSSPARSPSSEPVTNKVAPASSQSIALAVVFNAQELWVGNDDHEPEDSPARYFGALHDLASAFDKIPPGTMFAPDSQGLIVSFATGAKVHKPLGPLREITGASFGAQKDYRSAIGTDLVQGVALALEQLRGAPGLRPVIVILGDGNDTNNEAATDELTAMRAKGGASVHALVIKSPVSAEGAVIGALTPNVRVVEAGGLAEALGDIWQREASAGDAR